MKETTRKIASTIITAPVVVVVIGMRLLGANGRRS